MLYSCCIISELLCLYKIFYSFCRSFISFWVFLFTQLRSFVIQEQDSIWHVLCQMGLSIETKWSFDLEFLLGFWSNSAGITCVALIAVVWKSEPLIQSVFHLEVSCSCFYNCSFPQSQRYSLKLSYCGSLQLIYNWRLP